MIATLRGKISEVFADSAVIDCAGVGYEVLVTLSTAAEMQGHVGEEAQVFIHTHVREDILQLFGFLQRHEKQMFLSLLKVNGIGPKMAINILSGASANQIMDMIEQEDVKALTRLPKVGKKIAEQMVLALKGKVVRSAEEKASPQGSRAQISSALVNLGFRSQDVEKVVKGLPNDIEMQEGLRQGLAALTSL